MKNKTIVSKLAFIGAVVLLLLLANVLIGSKINDRRNVYEDAVANINASAGGSFSSEGFVIAVPYEIYDIDYFKNFYRSWEYGSSCKELYSYILS